MSQRQKEKAVEVVMPPADLVEVEDFVEQMMSSGRRVSLQECFRQASDIAAYMTAVRNKSMVLGSRYVANTVKAVGTMATEGDLEAARLLFDYLGLRVKTPIAQVNTAIQVNVPTLKDIIEIEPGDCGE